jgi:hypothetical protein
MLSPPAIAKRFHPKGAYDVHHRIGSHHHSKRLSRHNTRTVDNKTINVSRGWGPLAAVAAVPYLYANEVAVDRTPTTFDDRFWSTP